MGFPAFNATQLKRRVVCFVTVWCSFEIVV